MRNFKILAPAASAATAIGLCFFAGAPQAQAGTCTPVTDNSRAVTTTDCNELITLNANGTFSFSNPAGTSNYDGSDDQLVGFINNSNFIVKSLHLKGSGVGGGIFGFDNDGACDTARFTWLGGCPFDPSGYAGSNNSFANINGAKTSGDVVFTAPIGNGGIAEWALEAPAGALCTTCIVINTPEPGTLALLGGSLAALAGLAARRRRAAA